MEEFHYFKLLALRELKVYIQHLIQNYIGYCCIAGVSYRTQNLTRIFKTQIQSSFHYVSTSQVYFCQMTNQNNVGMSLMPFIQRKAIMDWGAAAPIKNRVFFSRDFGISGVSHTPISHPEGLEQTNL